MDATADLIEFAADQQRRFDSLTSPEVRKQRGHFGTPSPIVWESEVWIAEFPDHMIHFNGDKFLGPYPQRPTRGPE